MQLSVFRKICFDVNAMEKFTLYARQLLITSSLCLLCKVTYLCNDHNGFYLSYGIISRKLLRYHFVRQFRIRGPSILYGKLKKIQ